MNEDMTYFRVFIGTGCYCLPMEHWAEVYLGIIEGQAYGRTHFDGLDITDTRVIFKYSAVTDMHESTPEGREAHAEFNKMLAKEAKSFKGWGEDE